MATDQVPPGRRWRPRFSLLTLLLAVVFISASGGLWWRWEPWAPAQILTTRKEIGALHSTSLNYTLFAQKPERPSGKALSLHSPSMETGWLELEHNKFPRKVLLPPDHAGPDRQLEICDTATDELLAVAGSAGDWAAFSYSGRKLVVLGAQSGAQVWDSQAAITLGQPIDHDGENIMEASFSIDEVRLLTRSDVGTVCIWEAGTGRRMARLNAKGINYATFARKGEMIYTKEGHGSEERVTVWHRRRPEWWWGIAWLPEFWVVLASAALLLFLTVRRLLRRKAPRQNAA